MRHLSLAFFIIKGLRALVAVVVVVAAFIAPVAVVVVHKTNYLTRRH